MKINNLLPESYHAPCIIVIAGDIKTDHPDPKILNGFGEHNTDFNEYVLEGEGVKFYDSSYMNILWNQVDEKLYTVNRFVVGKPISEELLKKLGEDVQGQWSDGIGEGFEQEPVMTTEDGEEIFISPWHKDQELHVTMIPVEIPQDHYWLGTLFDTPEKQMMYEDFMCDPVINKRLNKLIDVKKIEVPEGVNRDNTPELPIHKKDKTTGELLISKTILDIFMQYQFAQNYIRGFEPETVEFDAGKLMMLYPRFCEFMMSCAQMQAEGKEIRDFTGNYQRELKKAIKYLNKHGELLYMFENWSELYTPKEALSEQ